VIEEDMAGKAARLEQRMHAALHSMAKEFEIIGDIRGRGVLVGIEFVTDRDKKTPANAEVAKIDQYCLEHGLIFQLRGTRGDLNVIRLVPPMTTTAADVDRAMSILRDAIAAVLN
jgi:2,2-dialkylglycine decarboxylase (pyruvate)